MCDSVQTDLSCVTCRYNLRTLRLEGRCPECGAPVRESVNAPRDEPLTQLIIVFVAYLAINVAAYAIMTIWDRRRLVDVAPIVYFHGPLAACMIVGASRYFGNRLRWITYFAFVLAMGLVAGANRHICALWS